jgi:hypothetical protein
MQTTAYFTVPIKRPEERGEVDPPPVVRRTQGGLRSATLPVAVLIAAATSAWLFWQMHEPAPAVAKDAVVVTLAQEIPAAEPLPAAPTVLAATVEPPAALIEAALEVEPAAGGTTLARGEVIRQRPGAVPPQDEVTPPTPPAARDVTEAPDTEHLIQRGDALMLSGDIVSARLVYERAAATGSPHAMMAMAQSYDPALLRKLGARGIRPEPEQAQRWYAKATEVHGQRR